MKWKLVPLLALPIVGVAVLLLAAPAGPGAGPAPTPLPPEAVKWVFISAAIVTGMAAIGAAIAVAIVGSAAMGAVAEKPETAGRALIFVGLAEGIAIYGLIIAIMILGRLP
jgi:V/A-type H+/Na+-transporting ATPase subunit K